MIIHENGKKYRVWLRAGYAHIHSERQLRAIIERTINALPPADQLVLRKLTLWQLMGVWGMTSKKTEII